MFGFARLLKNEHIRCGKATMARLILIVLEAFLLTKLVGDGFTVKCTDGEEESNVGQHGEATAETNSSAHL